MFFLGSDSGVGHRKGGALSWEADGEHAEGAGGDGPVQCRGFLGVVLRTKQDRARFTDWREAAALDRFVVVLWWRGETGAGGDRVGGVLFFAGVVVAEGRVFLAGPTLRGA